MIEQENKETTNSQLTTHEEQKCTQKELPNHSIFNYFKEHPSMFIALVSGIVAVIAFLINYMSYARVVQELLFWNVDSAMININNPMQFYSICFSLVSSTLMLFSTSLISNSYISYSPFKKYMLRAKRELIEIGKSTNNSQKRVKKARIKIQKLTNIQEKSDLLKENDEINEFISGNVNKIKSIKSNIKKVKKHYYLMLCLNLVVAYIIVIISSIFLICSPDYKTDIMNPIIAALVVSIVEIIIVSCIGYVMMRITIAIEMKREPSVPYEVLVNKIDDVEYPLAKLHKNGFRAIFSNSTILSVVLNVVILLIVSLLVMSIIPYEIHTKSTQYKMLSIDNTNYMVVYVDTEKMIIEEVDIEDKIATVYTYKQQIIPIDSYPYEIVVFDKIIRENVNTSQ